MATLPNDPVGSEMLGFLPRPRRSTIMGTRHAVASCHYLASQAAFQVLEAGGNAVDAGVAAGIALGVLEPPYVSFAGVVPIIVYLADCDSVVTISGLGVWPKAANCEFFQKRYGGALPRGVHLTIVPAAPDAWITALERYGTWSFGNVAAAAIRLARDGFPMNRHMSDQIKIDAEAHREWPANAAIYLPGGLPPEPGELFFQKDQARTLQYMADEEAAAGRRGGRVQGLKAARDAFYRGDIAQTILAYHRKHDGLLAESDLAEFRVEIEPPLKVGFAGMDVYTCGPWCQGPMLLQSLVLMDPAQLRAIGHNTVEYIHHVIEVIKLAAADREAYYGDPRFVDVPMAGLLAPKYSARRAAMIRDDRAWPGLPPPGDPAEAGTPFLRESRETSVPRGKRSHNRTKTPGVSPSDTSYVCVVDRFGNAFSGTPSDMATHGPVIPGLGFAISPRGTQSWTDPTHPSCVAPGKRPRLTPSPALAIRKGRQVVPFGTPGGDTQTQVMLQVFLNMFVFDMEPQIAVEEARFVTYSFPSSFEPHAYYPGEVRLEVPIPREAGERLTALGHKVQWWPEWWTRYGTGVCVIVGDRETGVLACAADPRRTGSAVAL